MRLATVLVLACIQYVIIVDESAIALLAPVVGRDFAMGDDARHALVTPFAAAFVLALPAAAALLHRADPRRILVPVTIAFGVCAAAGALARSPMSLMLARAAQGASAGLTATCVLAALHLLTRDSATRLRDFAVFSVVSGAGAISALVVAGPLATVSWRWCFVAVAVGAAILGCAWPAVLRAAQPATDRPVTARSVADLAVTHGTGEESAVAPANRSQRFVSPPVAVLTIAASNALLAASVITVSFAVQDEHGWTATAAGLAFLPLNAAAALSAAAVARASRQVGSAAVTAVGIALLASGCAGLAAADDPAHLIAAGVPIGLGIGLVFPLVNDRALAGSRSGLRRAAVVGAAQQVGLAVGALVAAIHRGSALVALAACAGLAVIGALVWISRTDVDAVPNHPRSLRKP